jgi:hypothetical protein
MTAPTPEYKARVKLQGGLSDKAYAAKLAMSRDLAEPGPHPAPELTLVDAPQEPVRSTLHRMVDVLRGRQPEPVSVGGAFDGATLTFDQPIDEGQPLWPRNPVPAGEPTRRPGPTRRGGRPPGSEDLTPLFATGLVLLTTFALGEWAAPTADEASAIAVPFSNILARRIDIAAKLGRDASDTIALAVAIMAYSYRVVPLANERVRSSLERRNAERVSRAGPGRDDTAEFALSTSPDGMATGTGNGQGPQGYPAYSPLDAIAKARNAGLNLFAGSPNGASDGRPSVVDR